MSTIGRKATLTNWETQTSNPSGEKPGGPKLLPYQMPINSKNVEKVKIRQMKRKSFRAVIE
jgi:hypothetical protein